MQNESIYSDPKEDYKSLIKAVFDIAISDYYKLQHPRNRNKKYLEEGFSSAVAMFFDPEFRFDVFLSPETDSNLSTEELISIMIDSNNVSIKNAQKHVIDKSIDYWWEKNFHDLKVPSKVTLVGKVWHISTAQTLSIDYNKNKIYLPIKKSSSDRLYIQAVLTIILNELNITLSEEDFFQFHKFFYLFLKVNDAFPKN